MAVSRVLVYGGRDFSDFDMLSEFLVNHFPAGAMLIHGAARGADSMADRWARSRGSYSHGFPADWDKFGKAAGAIRNQRMLDEGNPELAIEFPGGRGTADMRRRLLRRGIRIIRAPNGR